MKINTLILSAALFLFHLSSKGQSFEWEAGFLGFFDNREYFNNYTEPQTMFGSRAFGSVGLALNDHQKITVGIDFLYEFGSSVSSENVNPIIYFSHNTDPVKLFIGAFHRQGLINMPNFMLSDTLNYYRPNVEGTFIEFRKPWGFQNIWLDWTSRQTDFNRETFMLGGSGGLNFGWFFYRHDFLMYHFAGPAIAIPEDHIRDNGGLNLAIGIDLSSRTSMDTLRLNTGLALSYDRIRNVYDTQITLGSLTEFMAQYRGVGVKNTLSIGEGQVQMLGDAMYKADFYNRTDFYWNFFRKKNIRGMAEFSIHVLPEVTNFSQRLVVFFDITGSKPLKSRKEPVI